MMCVQGLIGGRQLNVTEGPGGSRATVRRYPTAVMVAVSVLTIAFLILQLTVGVRQSDRMHPVTGYSMFSHASEGSLVELTLEGTMPDGRAVELRPEELGLTRMQLRRNLAADVLTAEQQVAVDRLGEIADIWSERQHEELHELTLLRREHRIDDAEVRSEVVASWGG